MKLNLATKILFCLGFTCTALPALALEAWSGQEGNGSYEVIFNSGVYTNAWWVGAANCPGTAAADEANNSWRYERVATSSEISKYGNPTSCETSGGNVTYPEYNGANTYQVNDIVSYKGATYKTPVAQNAYGFAPGESNPWALYTVVAEWASSKTYNKGDKVQKNGQEYEALFYSVGDDPSLAANQNPTGSNGRPWKPLGAVVSYTQEQLKKAPQFSSTQLYQSGMLIRYNGLNYVSQSQVQKVTPSDTNPWKIFIDWSGTKEMVGKPTSPWPAHVYAPYVDYTLNSQPDLASLANNQNVKHFTMAFVVSKDADTCLPTWGTAYNINNYTQYSKIKALRAAGGDVMVSIGGANNSPLAAACKNVADLQQLYYDIVDNLNLNVLDFDIEGTWVADHDSINRRNLAVKAVQDQWKTEGRDIGIWYTLPILPTGLTGEGLYVLNDAKEKGVKLAGVNVMTMDYGNSICQSEGTEGQNIHGKCATSAIENLHSQLKQIFADKTDEQINAMMGTTPMVGYNDVQGEVFYMSDAKLVMKDATDRGLGMIGIWSMMRDQPGVPKQVSPEHSGLTEQQASQYAFSKVFAPFTQASDMAPVTTTIRALKGARQKNDAASGLYWEIDKASFNGKSFKLRLHSLVTGGVTAYNFGKGVPPGVCQENSADANYTSVCIYTGLNMEKNAPFEIVGADDNKIYLSSTITQELMNTANSSDVVSSRVYRNGSEIFFDVQTTHNLISTRQFLNIYLDKKDSKGVTASTEFIGSYYFNKVPGKFQDVTGDVSVSMPKGIVTAYMSKSKVKAGDVLSFELADGDTSKAKRLNKLSSVTVTANMLK